MDIYAWFDVFFDHGHGVNLLHNASSRITVSNASAYLRLHLARDGGSAKNLNSNAQPVSEAGGVKEKGVSSAAAIVIVIVIAAVGGGYLLMKGEGEECPARNPRVSVMVNRVGVFDDCDPFIRGAGEIYLYIVITDGNVTRERRLPSARHFELDDDESVDVGTSVFSVSEVGDYLSIFVIAYESDGEGFEPLVQEALAGAVVAWRPELGLLFEIFQVDLAQIIGRLLGSEDDFVGSYEHTWYKVNSWGAGTHYEEDQNLRLWFTISQQ